MKHSGTFSLAEAGQVQRPPLHAMVAGLALDGLKEAIDIDLRGPPAEELSWWRRHWMKIVHNECVRTRSQPTGEGMVAPGMALEQEAMTASAIRKCGQCQRLVWILVASSVHMST